MTEEVVQRRLAAMDEEIQRRIAAMTPEERAEAAERGRVRTREWAERNGFPNAASTPASVAVPRPPVGRTGPCPGCGVNYAGGTWPPASWEQHQRKACPARPLTRRMGQALGNAAMYAFAPFAFAGALIAVMLGTGLASFAMWLPYGAISTGDPTLIVLAVIEVALVVWWVDR